MKIKYFFNQILKIVLFKAIDERITEMKPGSTIVTCFVYYHDNRRRYIYIYKQH